MAGSNKNNNINYNSNLRNNNHHSNDRGRMTSWNQNISVSDNNLVDSSEDDLSKPSEVLLDGSNKRYSMEYSSFNFSDAYRTSHQTISNSSVDSQFHQSNHVLSMDFCQPPPIFNTAPSHNVFSTQFPPFLPLPMYNSAPIPQGVQPPCAPPPFPVIPFNTASTSVLPPIFNTTCPPPNTVASESDITFERRLENWITFRKLSTENNIPKKPSTRISDYKKKLVNFTTQLKELEKMYTRLHIMNKSLADDEWLVRKSEVEDQKIIVEEAMADLKKTPLSQITFLLKRRKSKRKRLKRKKEEFRLIKKRNKVICQLEHSRIDMWLEKMKEHVERTRREEDIKKQADYVLSEVFHKKAEAKRMLTLLTTLGKLRNARIQNRESKGEFVSKEAAAAFNNIIDSLKKRWVNQINGYNLEEQGLRVMLDNDEIKRSNVEKSLSKQILQQWLNIIFGVNNKSNPFQVTNIDELIRVRKTWDQYVVEDDCILGSSIPNGWVLPTPPSEEEWSKLIKNS